MIYSIPIKKLYDDAILPTKGSIEAAGHDLYAYTSNDIKIYPHENALIKTGIAVELPMGVFGGIFARSGIANKRHLRPSNCVGKNNITPTLNRGIKREG